MVLSKIASLRPDKVYEALLRFYPVHAGQRCNSPVCRRIRFIFGETFTHDAINHETHLLLYELFGEANLTILNHLTRVIRAGHVIDHEVARAMDVDLVALLPEPLEVRTTTQLRRRH